ncbi:hypothetical protein diail_11960 [Diaporthe ilicicola]|nr:hypothetical protein diail_11960 [Diaporthe ilicicola]
MAPGTVVLGKRKRKVPADKVAGADAKSDKAAALEDAQAIFRKHFEAQFAPLGGSDDEESRPAAKPRRRRVAAGTELDGDGEAAGVEDMRSETSDSEGDDDSRQDEWDGISAAEDDDDQDDDSEDSEGDDDSGEGDETEETNPQVEVVDYSKPTPSFSTLTPQAALMTKREMRAYLSSRPPDAVSTTAAGGKGKPQRAKQQGGDGNDDPQNEDSRSLLASDLELQRLISESHILSATNPFNTAASGASHASSRAFSEGRTRALTTDLRLQKLGSKDSIFRQQKMPMGMRKGISGAKASREEKRRREAKENGIILERPEEAAGGSGSSKAKKRQQNKRPGLPVDMPGMGRMKGGELRLSKRDVRAVEREGKRMSDSGGKKGNKHRKRR